jgi:hypothetical protein
MLPADADGEFETAPDPEQLWANLLSEDASLIVPALRAMDPAERSAVLSHLKRMAEEDGWSAGQARRARAALAIAAKDPHLMSSQSGA